MGRAQRQNGGVVVRVVACSTSHQFAFHRCTVHGIGFTRDRHIAFVATNDMNRYSPRSTDEQELNSFWVFCIRRAYFAQTIFSSGMHSDGVPTVDAHRLTLGWKIEKYSNCICCTAAPCEKIYIGKQDILLKIYFQFATRESWAHNSICHVWRFNEKSVARGIFVFRMEEERKKLNLQKSNGAERRRPMWNSGQKILSEIRELIKTVFVAQANIIAWISRISKNQSLCFFRFVRLLAARTVRRSSSVHIFCVFVFVFSHAHASLYRIALRQTFIQCDIKCQKRTPRNEQAQRIDERLQCCVLRLLLY